MRPTPMRLIPSDKSALTLLPRHPSDCRDELFNLMLLFNYITRGKRPRSAVGDVIA